MNRYDLSDHKIINRTLWNYLPDASGNIFVFDDVTSKMKIFMKENIDILYTNRRVFWRRLRKRSVTISKNLIIKSYKVPKFWWRHIHIFFRIDFLELGWEITYVHLKVFYIDFWELSNGGLRFQFWSVWIFEFFSSWTGKNDIMDMKESCSNFL